LKRKSKKDYYLDIAKAVSERSPCLKLHVGAVIVKDDCIVSTGYNGPARGIPHCNVCSRENVPHRSSYSEECPSVHAEENAVINAARQGTSVVGGIMYVYTGEDLYPCYRCIRVINNSGIKKVYYK